MIKKIDQKRIADLKKKAKETVSLNVVLNIGLMELEIKEELSSNDPII